MRAYLAEALRTAWAELKADPVFQECQKIIARIRARQARLGGRHVASSRFAHPCLRRPLDRTLGGHGRRSSRPSRLPVKHGNRLQAPSQANRPAGQR